MIDNYINKQYINNSSDILSLFNEKYILDIFNNIKDEKIIIKSKMIHKKNTISLKEQFIFNIDNYITFVKNNVFIDSLQIRYVILLTLNNKYNSILYNKTYYYDNIDLYINEFKKLFMYNYKKNVKLLNKYIIIKEKNFNELVNNINKHKKRIYAYFENINSSNINHYIPIICKLEDII